MFGVVYVAFDGELLCFATDVEAHFVRMVTELNINHREFIWWRP